MPESGKKHKQKKGNKKCNMPQKSVSILNEQVDEKIFF